MSKLETNIIAPSTGTTITIGESGDTIALGSGATQTGFGGVNTPAFSAYFLSTTNSLPTNTPTLVAYNGKYFDTDNAYNTSTGKFTVPTGKGGKYFFTATVSMASAFAYVIVYIYKNGVSVSRGHAVNNSSTGGVYALIDCSVGDEIQVYCYQGGTTQDVVGGISSQFNGYKIIE